MVLLNRGYYIITVRERAEIEFNNKHKHTDLIRFAESPTVSSSRR